MESYCDKRKEYKNGCSFGSYFNEVNLINVSSDELEEGECTDILITATKEFHALNNLDKILRGVNEKENEQFRKRQNREKKSHRSFSEENLLYNYRYSAHSPKNFYSNRYRDHNYRKSERTRRQPSKRPLHYNCNEKRPINGSSSGDEAVCFRKDSERRYKAGKIDCDRNSKDKTSPNPHHSISGAQFRKSENYKMIRHKIMDSKHSNVFLKSTRHAIPSSNETSSYCSDCSSSSSNSESSESSSSQSSDSESSKSSQSECDKKTSIAIPGSIGELLLSKQQKGILKGDLVPLLGIIEENQEEKNERHIKKANSEIDISTATNSPKKEEVNLKSIENGECDELMLRAQAIQSVMKGFKMYNDNQLSFEENISIKRKDGETKTMNSITEVLTKDTSGEEMKNLFDIKTPVDMDICSSEPEEISVHKDNFCENNAESEIVDTQASAQELIIPSSENLYSIDEIDYKEQEFISNYTDNYNSSFQYSASAYMGLSTDNLADQSLADNGENIPTTSKCDDSIKGKLSINKSQDGKAEREIDNESLNILSFDETSNFSETLYVNSIIENSNAGDSIISHTVQVNKAVDKSNVKDEQGDDDEDILRAQLLIGLSRKTTTTMKPANKLASHKKKPTSKTTTGIKQLTDSRTTSDTKRDTGKTKPANNLATSSSTKSKSTTKNESLSIKSTQNKIEKMLAPTEVKKIAFPSVKPVIINLQDDTDSDEECVKAGCSSSSSSSGGVNNQSNNILSNEAPKRVISSSKDFSVDLDKLIKSCRMSVGGNENGVQSKETVKSKRISPKALKHLSLAKQKEYSRLLQKLDDRQIELNKRKNTLNCVQCKPVKLLTKVVEKQKMPSKHTPIHIKAQRDKKCSTSYDKPKERIQKTKIDVECSNPYNDVKDKVLKEINKFEPSVQTVCNNEAEPDLSEDEESLREKLLENLNRQNKSNDKSKLNLPKNNSFDSCEHKIEFIDLHSNTAKENNKGKLHPKGNEIESLSDTLSILSNTAEGQNVTLSNISTVNETTNNGLPLDGESVHATELLINESIELKSSTKEFVNTSVTVDHNPESIEKLFAVSAGSTNTRTTNTVSSQLDCENDKTMGDKNSSIKIKIDKSSSHDNLEGNYTHTEHPCKSSDPSTSHEETAKINDSADIKSNSNTKHTTNLKNTGPCNKTGSSSIQTSPRNKKVPAKIEMAVVTKELQSTKLDNKKLIAQNQHLKRDIILKQFKKHLVKIEADYIKERTMTKELYCCLERLVNETSHELQEKQTLADEIIICKAKLLNLESELQVKSNIILKNVSNIKVLHNKASENQQKIDKLEILSKKVGKEVVGSDYDLASKFQSGSSHQNYGKEKLVSDVTRLVHKIKENSPLLCTKYVARNPFKKNHQPNSNMIKKNKYKLVSKANQPCPNASVEKKSSSISEQKKTEVLKGKAGTASAAAKKKQVLKVNTPKRPISKGTINSMGMKNEEKVQENANEKINVRVDCDVLCPYELLGRCNDDNCLYQHYSRINKMACNTISEVQCSKSSNISTNYVNLQPAESKINSSDDGIKKVVTKDTETLCDFSKSNSVDLKSKGDAKIKVLINDASSVSSTGECSAIIRSSSNSGLINSFNTGHSSSFNQPDVHPPSVKLNSSTSSVNKEMSCTNEKRASVRSRIIQEEEKSYKCRKRKVKMNVTDDNDGEEESVSKYRRTDHTHNTQYNLQQENCSGVTPSEVVLGDSQNQ